jgi:hypothetical protein
MQSDAMAGLLNQSEPKNDRRDIVRRNKMQLKDISQQNIANALANKVNSEPFKNRKYQQVESKVA